MCLVPIRGWPHRVTGASNGFAGGGALSVVEPFVSSGRGMGRSVRCGCQAPPGRPHDDRQRRLLYCRAVPLFREGDGEKCLQSQACVTRPWCGPGGYIQVGMRGCEPGGESARRFRQRKRSVPPFGEQFSLGFWGREKISVAIQAPSLGRERPLVARPECA